MENKNQTHAFETHFSKQDLQTLLNELPEPMCLLSSTTDQKPNQFIFANKRALNLFQIMEQELCSYTWTDVFGLDPTEDLEALEEATAEIPHRFEQSPLSRHLSGRALRIHLQDVVLESGGLYFLLTIIDATEHYETKEKLRATSSEFESLFKYNPNIVYTINKEGAKSKTYSISIKSQEHSDQAAFQETTEFKTISRSRYKIEAKNSELKNRHGYNKASYGGLFGMQIQGATTIFAVNLKRIIKLMQ